MTQEGEKEIVLGNKQLISLFFVVVALMGVSFAAGYMIARKSALPATTAADAGSLTPSSASTSPLKQDSEAARETAPPPDPGPGTTMEQPLAVSVAKPRPVPDAPKDFSKEDQQKPPLSTATRELAKPSTAVTKPEMGATYLQVTALRRDDADNLVRSLQEQNFPVMLAASSKEGLYRVLVGPYHETAKVAESKSRLKALGFANAFVQK